MRIVLLGPPGAGKGTQATRIVDEVRVPHLSTGDMLRAAALADTEFGSEVRQTMASGQLVSDQVIVAAVMERISLPDARRGFVLDGFPRTMSQAVTFDDHLDRQGMTLDHVIELRADEEILLDRIMTRAQQARETGSAARADDNRDTLKVRLDAYNELTAPLIEYYRERSLLRSIDGLQAVDDVTADLLKVIGSGSSVA
ncbi:MULTISPECIES: adenylate kinase [Bradyrhizobium]|jgi:adenylate kinase|uniref:Adenylate kinase n=2 Tax=Bradyrhizobium TaxID=374 RepID=A0ABY0Q0J6_9BRAD|nr:MULTISPECIES: adenylate kinase [Bradyrhizobium]SDJ30064.1 Adenylate kinase [Bradyrhizobium ottawaense]SEC71365.1 Adenylate kinase [Bradyrhizobium lablabi]